MNTTTCPIKIVVEPFYLDNISQPARGHYIFAYTITIFNQGEKGAQLLRRHWIITDADGHVDEVKGEGVVGEQPYIKPGTAFQYTSYAVIKTPVGNMQGNYQMLGDDQQEFIAPIPIFRLAMPGVLN